MREYTIDDFAALYHGPDPITEKGRFDSYDSCTDNLNLSAILTKLIQEAGRWCESFASDLFVDWGAILHHLDQLGPDSENRSFLFGFRKDGVDHTEWVLSRFNNYNAAARSLIYRKIYRLDVWVRNREVLLRLYEVEAH
jgi:hypothetical protein